MTRGRVGGKDKLLNVTGWAARTVRMNAVKRASWRSPFLVESGWRHQTIRQDEIATELGDLAATRTGEQQELHEMPNEPRSSAAFHTGR
jgi:predicted DNA binding protein